MAASPQDAHFVPTRVLIIRWTKSAIIFDKILTTKL